VSGRDRGEEERSESFGKDPDFDVPHQQGDDRQRGKELDSEDEDVSNDVRRPEEDEAQPPRPSPMQDVADRQENEVYPEGKGEASNPCAVEDENEIPCDSRLQEAKEGRWCQPQGPRDQARLGRAVILRRARAKGVAGSQSTTVATRRSCRTTFARSIARIW